MSGSGNNRGVDVAVMTKAVTAWWRGHSEGGGSESDGGGGNGGGDDR